MATWNFNPARSQEMAAIRHKDEAKGMSGPQMRVFKLPGGGVHVEHHGFHSAVALPGRRRATLLQRGAHANPSPGLTASHTFKNADEFKSHLEDVFGDAFVHAPTGAHLAVHVPQYGTINTEPEQEQD